MCKLSGGEAEPDAQAAKHGHLRIGEVNRETFFSLLVPSAKPVIVASHDQ